MIANYAWHGRPARLDGPAAARHRGRASSSRTDGRRGEPIDEPDDRGRAGAEARLAVDVPRLPRRRRSATAACFAGGWYLTGDLARRDADGYFWFVGRADDVIKSAGHLIGPFEVESALMEHPAVAEAAVIGKPDPLVGEVVKAFVALQARRQTADEALRARAARPRAQAARRRGGAARDRRS